MEELGGENLPDSPPVDPPLNYIHRTNHIVHSPSVKNYLKNVSNFGNIWKPIKMKQRQ